MITHIVFFKLKERSEAVVSETVNVLRNMEGKIPQLRYIEVGVDVLHTERSYDIALITKFDTLDDLQAYQVHPVHQEVIRHMNNVRESSVAVDYES
ncbi:Stress responsive A/B Barrel Domain [Chlamydia abortus]|uniref:Dabb family protein n=1 Tax=Paenibacillus residui TaxID=629724 RepID=A0ABW3D7D5_9BACL|nr:MULTISPECIES: Dabb family protein [Paenibacillaceae]SHE14031.1 Stress responsive A/B Barrel Domain [Chlamydia abortus]